MFFDPRSAAMETQSAFMAVAAGAVLLGAVLLIRRDRTALSFAALIAAFTAFCFGRGVASLGHSWAHGVVAASLAALGALIPLVATRLTAEHRLERRLRPLLVLGFGFLIAALWVSSGAHESVQLAVTVALGGWALAGTLGGAAVMVRYAPDPAQVDWSDATRLRYLAVAHVIVALAEATDVLLWKLQGPRVASLLVPLLYLYAGYLHLAQVRVSDLRQLMGTAMALTVMAVGLAACFGLIRIWAGERLDLFLFNSFVASFALLVAFPSVRDRLCHLMDRYFMASKLELERVLADLGARLTHIRTLDDLLKDLLGTLEQIDRVRSSSIFLRDAPHLGFQQAGSIGLSPRARVNLIRDPIWTQALEQEEALLYVELEKLLLEARSQEDKERLERLCATMRDLDAQLVLGLRSERGLVGFWSLSDAHPHEPFSTTEVRLLRSVADRISVSVENSKTFERIRARDRMASLGEMATGLAHEIRNPLATIRGALAVLADPAAEGREEFGAVVLEEIDRLDRVVGTFLDYASPHTRRAPLSDVDEFVRGCVAAVARRHPDGSATVRIEVEDEIPPITTDADQLERVIMNVLTNAYDALDGPGLIRVEVRADAGTDPVRRVEITVSDDGLGMDEATLERAFVPFFTTKETGSGLGLALCEKLIRNQGGSIEIQSKPGRGTTVRILLPCDAPPGDAKAALELGEP